MSERDREHRQTSGGVSRDGAAPVPGKRTLSPAPKPRTDASYRVRANSSGEQAATEAQVQLRLARALLAELVAARSEHSEGHAAIVATRLHGALAAARALATRAPGRAAELLAAVEAIERDVPSLASARREVDQHDEHAEVSRSTASDAGHEPRGTDVGRYLAVHAVDLRASLDRYLAGVLWADPAEDLPFVRGAERIFGQRLAAQVGEHLEDEAGMFALVSPHDLAAEIHRRVPDMKHAAWSPAVGTMLAMLVERTAATALATRVGPRYRRALASQARLPVAADIVAGHPIDPFVIAAVTIGGVLDASQVAATERPATPSAPAGIHWLGRSDRALWNCVEVEGPTTLEQLAATLWRDPAKTTMAHAIQRIGDVYRVDPAEARKLLAERYPSEVIGPRDEGVPAQTARLARRKLVDREAPVRPFSEGDADRREEKPAPTTAELMKIEHDIGDLLAAIRATIARVGLADELAPAFVARTDRVALLADADAGTRRRWLPVLQFQHTQLLSIRPQLGPLVEQLLPIRFVPPHLLEASKQQLRKALVHRLDVLAKAAGSSHLRDESSALLGQLASADREARLDALDEGVIEIQEATRIEPAATARGKRDVEDATAGLERSRGAAVHGKRPGGSRAEQQRALTAAGSYALRARMTNAERQLEDLRSAAIEVFGSGDALHRILPGVKTLPEVILSVKDHLAEVDRVWDAAYRAALPDAAEASALEDAGEAQAKAAGLAAAREAFGRIAGDQSLVDFMTEASKRIATQQIWNKFVTLAGTLLIMVGTGMAASMLGAAARAALLVEGAGTALRVGAVVADVGINVSINSMVQLAQGKDASVGDLGWTMLENALVEIFTRNLLGPLKRAEQVAQRQAAAFASLPHLAPAERAALMNLNLGARAMVGEMVGGMATQWAAHRLLEMYSETTQAKAKEDAEARARMGEEVSDPFAQTVLEQGAAIALGKFFHGRIDAWHATRKQLAATHLGQSPEAAAYFGARDEFYRYAEELATSLSPDPAAEARLLAMHEALMAREHEIFGAQASHDRTAEATRDATSESDAARSSTEGVRAVSGTAKPGADVGRSTTDALGAVGEAAKPGRKVGSQGETAGAGGRYESTGHARGGAAGAEVAGGAAGAHVAGGESGGGHGSSAPLEAANVEVLKRGLMFAASVGEARYEGNGIFRVTSPHGHVLVEVRRSNGHEPTIRRVGDHLVLEVPRGISDVALERAVVGKLTEIHFQERRRANGEKATAASALGDKGTGERLSPEDMGRVAELRVLRESAAAQDARGEAGLERAAALRAEIARLEARMGLAGDTAEAVKRRHAVELHIEAQADSTRRARVARELDGDRGHPGVEVHGHLMGVVTAEVFRQRAATAGGKPDTGSWIPLLERIAKLSGKEFEHGRDGALITKRAPAGDAVKIARDARDQVRTLLDRAADANSSSADRGAYERAAESVAQEAAEVALAASPETDFNSAYEVRDQLVKDTFGGPAKDGEAPDVGRQRAYDDYLRESILQLAADGVGYSEQSISIKKLAGVMRAERVAAAIEQLVAEGKIQPGEIDVRLLSMLHTAQFGERDPNLPAANAPPRSDTALWRDTEASQRQIRDPGVVGWDVGGAEHFDFDERGADAFEHLYLRDLAEANRTGTPRVMRPHVGEGAVDPVAGKPFHTDQDRVVKDGEPSHYQRARDNIDVMLGVLENVQRRGQLDPTKVIVRLGHVAHATPVQAARMHALGVIAEVNLGSNIQTGSVSQTEGVHGNRAAAERLDDHSFPTLMFYDVSIILSTDAGGVMSTTLRAEYQRARQAIEDVIAGARPVRVRAEDVRDPNTGVTRGREAPGRPDMRELSLTDMTAAERGRFLHGYEKLYADAQSYYLRRPKPGGVNASAPSAASPLGGAHHLDIAAKRGLIAGRSPGVLEGSPSDVRAAAQAYRDKSYQVHENEMAGGRLVVEVRSPDGEFRTSLQSWGGDAPSYLPVSEATGAQRTRGTSNRDVRSWYKAQIQRVAALNADWVAGGVPLAERARRAYEVRKHARLAAREQMASSGEVQVLEVRDIAEYGAEGVTFEGLVAEHQGAGLSLEQAYEAIIRSSQRSNAGYDRKHGAGDTR